MNLNSENFPQRPAWTEIDLGKLRRNLRLIRRDLPRNVKLLAVVKDEAYGHGALDVARIARRGRRVGLRLEHARRGDGAARRRHHRAAAAARRTAGGRTRMVRGARPDRLRERTARRPQAGEDRGGLRQTSSGSRQNPHRHEPLRRALGRGAAAHRKNCRGKIACRSKA